MVKRPHSPLEEQAQSPIPDPSFGVSLSGGTPKDGQQPSNDGKKLRRSVPKTGLPATGVVGAEQGSGGSHGTQFPRAKLHQSASPSSASPTAAQSSERQNDKEPREKDSNKKDETSKKKHPIGLPPLKRARTSPAQPPLASPSSAAKTEKERPTLLSKKGALLGGSKKSSAINTQPAGLCGAALPPLAKKPKLSSPQGGTAAGGNGTAAAGSPSFAKPFSRPPVIDLTAQKPPLGATPASRSQRGDMPTRGPPQPPLPPMAGKPAHHSQPHHGRASTRVQRTSSRSISIPNWVTKAASAPIVNDTLLGAAARTLPGAQPPLWRAGLNDTNVHPAQRARNSDEQPPLPGWEALQAAAAAGGRDFDTAQMTQTAIDVGYRKHSRQQEAPKIVIPSRGKSVVSPPRSLLRHGFSISEFAARFSATAAGLTPREASGQTLRGRTLRAMRPIAPADKKKDEEVQDDPMAAGRALASKLAPLIPGGKGGRGGVGARRERLKPGPKPRQQQPAAGAAALLPNSIQPSESRNPRKLGGGREPPPTVWPRGALAAAKKGDPKSVSLDHLAQSTLFNGSGLDKEVWRKLWAEKNISSTRN